MLGSAPALLEWSGLDPAQPVRADIVEIVAAAVLHGFRFTDKCACHERAIYGAERLEQFKDTPRARLHCCERFFFRPGQTVALSAAGADRGRRITVQDFRVLMETDAAFRALVRSHPRLQAFKDRLTANLLRAKSHVIAVESYGPATRLTYGQIHGDPATLAAFARMHSDGTF